MILCLNSFYLFSRCISKSFNFIHSCIKVIKNT
nr:MAG TPA: hypothetical protein [Caudoviricetes sp.]